MTYDCNTFLHKNWKDVSLVEIINPRYLLNLDWEKGRMSDLHPFFRIKGFMMTKYGKKDRVTSILEMKAQ